MSAPATAGPASASAGIPGLEHERLWTRQPPRTTDPLHCADACPDCEGTGVDLGTA